uniref:hypothetical protein n=1 Tax=Photobacterium phosphoreum TaxID=659 RepID=UPI0018684EDC|nr:hypothetical protein [Photobacterium phosphoreum]
MANSTVLRERVVAVTINDLFALISSYFGYEYSEWEDDILDLQEKWEEQGYIEIYQTPEDREYGFIKDSSLNSAGNISPYYIGLFHARVTPEGNDPLVIIKFHQEEDGTIADMKFMLSHDDFFGDREQKNNHQQLNLIWKEVDGFIQQTDSMRNS